MDGVSKFFIPPLQTDSAGVSLVTSVCQIDMLLPCGHYCQVSLCKELGLHVVNHSQGQSGIVCVTLVLLTVWVHSSSHGVFAELLHCESLS